MPTARCKDISIHYEVAGSGPPILFISGTGGDLRHTPNTDDGPLAAAGTVAAYDQRGLGQSSKPDQPVAMADYADDAVALLDHLGWDRAHVVGVSFGGMVAQHVAVRAPERVSRLVLCCTSSGGAGGSSFPLHELADLPDDTRHRRMLAISDVRFDEAWQAAHPAETEPILELLRAGDATKADDEAAQVGARRQLEARASHDCFDSLEQITAPTLVCAGRFDGLAPLANSEALVDAIPDAQLRAFDGGHVFLMQDPAAFPAIVEFLADSGT